MKVQIILPSLIATLLFLIGCETTGSLQGDKFGAKITQLREAIADISVSIDGVVDNLDAIVESADTDPRLAFNAFSKSVDNIEKAHRAVTSQAKSLESAGKAYFEAWAKRSEEIINPDMRNASLKRAKELQGVFAKVQPLYAEADKAVGTFIADARDLRTLLSQDLSASGVKNAKKLIGSTIASLEDGKDEIDEIVKRLERIEAEFIAAKAGTEEE